MTHKERPAGVHIKALPLEDLTVKRISHWNPALEDLHLKIMAHQNIAHQDQRPKATVKWTICKMDFRNFKQMIRLKQCIMTLWNISEII